MSPKEHYKKHCREYDVPLFFQPFWLDACQYSWDVLTAETEGINAFWVFHIEKKKGFTFIRNPHLTPYTGFICHTENTKDPIKEKLIIALLNQLPAYDVFEIDLSHTVSTSFHLPAFICSEKITNIIKLTNEESIYSLLKPALKRQIKKADKSLHIIETDDIELFYSLHQKTFQKQDKEPGISFSIYKQYWNCCKENQCGKLFFIEDQQKNVHAALWMVYDNETSYYLAGGTDAAFYGSGAMSKLLWHSIQVSITLNKKQFDFEGSMLPSVNRFFKNFSPKEVKYLNLKKINSIIYRMLKRI